MAALISTRVGIIVGSLRTESISRRIAHALAERAPGSMEFAWIEIGDLPLYSEDFDDDPPAQWTRFRDEVRSCDGLLFVTPEYNRSIPGALKNATDIGSRPDEDANVFDGKPAAIVSVSPYANGGMAANHALRQNFVYINLRTMAQPEAYIGMAEDVVDEEGRAGSDESDRLLTEFMQAFAEWIALVGQGESGERPIVGMLHFLSPEPRRLARFWSELMRLPIADGATDDLVMLDFDHVVTPTTWIFGRATDAARGRAPLGLDIGVQDADTWADVATRAEALGAERVGEHEDGGIQWIEMNDPDGNRFRVFAPRPEAT
ncbi:hypothetical protein GCM10009775_30110 [Microbacterium aoyamense]|uniref:VOC domain-containing protein n=1 Tax=Microbacterium aoyamense TaxID=344166 RepID=A0ABP5B861_9MICO|nr:NAD(P)H-dependent oxidoreductase [Microbacterium aoyamense]